MKVGFFYFLPCELKFAVDESAGTINVDAIDSKFHLGYAFQDRSGVPDQTCFHYGNGPNGSMGTFLYPKPDGESDIPNFFDASHRQKWIRHRGAYIGRDIGHPCPGPDELIRNANEATGIPVIDQFNRSWIIPVIRARDPSRYCLPMEYCFDEDGQVYTRRRSRDEKIWDLSGILQDHLSKKHVLSDSDLTIRLAQVLGIYYRLSTAELAMMVESDVNPIVTQFAANVIAVVLDFRTWNEFIEEQKDDPEKKSEELEVQDSPNVSHGVQAEDHTMSPVGAT